MAKQKSMESEKLANVITEMSRLKYGRDGAIVEAEISKRAKL